MIKSFSAPVLGAEFFYVYDGSGNIVRSIDILNEKEKQAPHGFVRRLFVSNPAYCRRRNARNSCSGIGREKRKPW